MTSSLLTIWVLLCLGFTQPRKDASSNENLVKEYYTTTPSWTNEFVPQDEADAKAIWDSDRKEEVIASIWMYREKIRRFAITEKILDKINGYLRYTKQGNYWIVKSHYPQEAKNTTSMFRDLIFGLTYHENYVLAEYLDNFFRNKDETWIIIGMVLAKDMADLILKYEENQCYRDAFADKRNDQRKPFRFMLRAWVRHSREPIEKDNLDSKLITQDADALKKEYHDGGWHKNRDQIELILMRKSIKYARAVINEFETIMNQKKSLEDIILDSVHSHDLNHDLADAYAALATYIKNKHKYIAALLHKYSDGLDQWAAWVMCVAVVRQEEWSKIDEVFKQAHKGVSLSEFITQKLTQNKVMAQMIGMIVDSTYKPTAFAKKPVPGDIGQPPASPSTMPPLPPVTNAPP